MNPITNMKNLNKMNERELDLGIAGTKSSWHEEYSDSAWIFVGGLPYELTEGDVICIFSQYGEIVHINLVRDLQTGKSKGFAFICFEDQRSTILAVDNFNGAKVLNRLLRVDHVQTYKLPKNLEKLDEDRKKLLLEGCAPKPIVSASVPTPMDDGSSVKEEMKKKKKKKKEKRKKKSSSSSDISDSGKERKHVKKIKFPTSGQDRRKEDSGLDRSKRHEKLHDRNRHRHRSRSQSRDRKK